VKIGQNDIDIERLPRALVGGLRREPVEELLRRVEWDYSQLCFEHEKLKEMGERRGPGHVEAPDVPQAEVAATIDEVEARPVRQGRPREPDELARIALAAAQRAAREMRESARDDCELMLKKARSRIQKLERDFERAKATNNAELEELDAMMSEIREQMRSALQTILPIAADAVSVAAPVPDQIDAADGALPDHASIGDVNAAANAGSAPAPLIRSDR